MYLNQKLTIFFLCLFLNGWIMSQCPQTGPNEYSQCSIGIDEGNTHLVLSNDKLELHALIHHPDRGNDDDAHNVLVTIMSDIEINNGEVSVEKDGEFFTISFQGRYATVVVNALSRSEHLDVRYTSDNRCQYNISVSAVSMSVCDIDYTDNFWSKHSRCWTPAITAIPAYPGFELPDFLPVDVPTICQQILSNCDDCFSRQGLCAGASVRFELPQDVVAFDLYELKAGRPHSKPIAKGKTNGKYWSMKIPIPITKKNQSQYSFVINKKTKS